MKTEDLPCLGLFKTHSFCSWYRHNKKNLYYRECDLFGCSVFETAENLKIVGETILTEDKKDCTHEWGYWQTTADHFGLWLPPWAYKRKCRICGAEQKTELRGLEKI